MSYSIEITSPYDREDLVAEIWRENTMIAELNQESGTLNLLIYLNGEKFISLHYEDFLEAISDAKKLLLSSQNTL